MDVFVFNRFYALHEHNAVLLVHDT